jgi:hypothetical protein
VSRAKRRERDNIYNNSSIKQIEIKIDSGKMQRWWIGNSAEKAKTKDQAQSSKRNSGGHNKEAVKLSFRVFVNFDLNLHGKCDMKIF